MSIGSIQRVPCRPLPAWASRGLVPAARIVALIVEHKRRHGLVWEQMAQVLGCDCAEEAEALTRCDVFSRDRASLLLRALAGLPRPPTAHERQLAQRELTARQQRAHRRRRQAQGDCREDHR